jgi:hypothetical protein
MSQVTIYDWFDVFIKIMYSNTISVFKLKTSTIYNIFWNWGSHLIMNLTMNTQKHLTLIWKDNTLFDK